MTIQSPVFLSLSSLNLIDILVTPFFIVYNFLSEITVYLTIRNSQIEFPFSFGEGWNVYLTD
jgi:hypothetical protein